MNKLIKNFMKSKYFKFTPRVLKYFLADFVEISVIGQIMMFFCSLFTLLAFIFLTLMFPLTLLVAFPMWAAYELTGIDWKKLELRNKWKRFRSKLMERKQTSVNEHKSHKQKKLSFK